MKKLVLLFAALLVVGCGEKSLSDSAIEKALEEAVEYDSLQERNDLYYQVNKTKPYSGWAKVLYDSGQAEQLFGIKDGKREGRTLVWKDDGTKTLEATYKDGVIEGYLEVSEDYLGSVEGFPSKLIPVGGINTDLDGNRSRVEPRDGVEMPFYSSLVAGTVRKGELHGKWVGYWESGQKLFEGKFKEGKLDGSFKTWYENGQKESEADLKPAKDDEGLWLAYNSGYLRFVEPIWGSVVDGTEKMWFENGQMASETTFKDGKPDGSFTEWYENGQKDAEGTYKDGEPDGSWTTWHHNGQKSSERSWKGNAEVSSREWDRNGNEFSDGNGLRTDWHSDGTKRVEGMMKDFKRDGVWEYFGSDGTKRREATYKDGKEVSATSFRWHENGQKRIEVTWKDGKRISEKYWNSKGEEVETEFEVFD